MFTNSTKAFTTIDKDTTKTLRQTYIKKLAAENTNWICLHQEACDDDGKNVSLYSLKTKTGEVATVASSMKKKPTALIVLFGIRM